MKAGTLVRITGIHKRDAYKKDEVELLGVLCKTEVSFVRNEDHRSYSGTLLTTGGVPFKRPYFYKVYVKRVKEGE